MGGSAGIQGKAGNASDKDDALPAPPPTQSAKPCSEHDRLLFDVKDLIEKVEEKEITVNKLLETMKRPTKQARRDLKDDLATMSDEQLQHLQSRLEGDLEKLDKEEEQLIQARRPSSSSLPRAKTKAGAVLAVQSAAAASAPAALSAEERALLDNPEEILEQDYDYGMVWNRQYHGKPMGPKDESMRRKIREGTKRKVVQELGLRAWGASAFDARHSPVIELHCWIDETDASRIGNAPAGGDYILGRYDVVATKVKADLDRNWNWIKVRQKPEFWVVHAAAINIGESARASDFLDFCKKANGEAFLDEELYYREMEHIMANVRTAAESLRITDLVFFPFGMGAVLRHLGLLDSKFTDDWEMRRLRRRLANVFMDVLAKTPADMRIHVCLIFSDAEAQSNADALLRALLAPGRRMLRQMVTIHEEGDSLHLAQDLAWNKTSNVMLVNGANRCQLGNHWFDGRARMAMDENLHRRSWRMSAISYLLNGYGSVQCTGPRPPDNLKDTVTWLGGKPHTITGASK